MAIGPKDAKAREARPNLGESLNESNVDRAMRETVEVPDETVDRQKPVEFDESEIAKNRADIQAALRAERPPRDPLEGCRETPIFANIFRLEQRGMAVKIIFGENLGGGGAVARGGVVMTVGDFVGLANAISDFVAKIRQAADEAPGANDDKQV